MNANNSSSGAVQSKLPCSSHPVYGHAGGRRRFLGPCSESGTGVPADAPTRVLGEGQFCIAVLVEPDIVVRFPRHALGIEHLVHERRVVEVLGSHLDVAVPAPLAAELDNPPGRAFASHRLVPGDLVTRDFLDDLGRGDTDQLHDQVASLLLGLKAATSAATGVGVRTESLGEIAAFMAADVDALLRDRMSPVQFARATVELRAFAGVDRHDRSLCHADLGGNLVWDPCGQRLGVIDFGGACVSDPVLDLASLSALDESLAAAVAAQVPHLVGRVDDAQAVRSTFALQDALYGALQRDWRHVHDVLGSS
ncbi:MAG: phosphotransferase family protein [Acidimicrobiales bacterium]